MFACVRGEMNAPAMLIFSIFPYISPLGTAVLYILGPPVARTRLTGGRKLSLFNIFSTYRTRREARCLGNSTKHAAGLKKMFAGVNNMMHVL